MTPKPRLESSIIWFEGYGPESEFFGPALLAGGFELPDGTNRRAWPAAVEVLDPGDAPFDDRATRYGRRIGIDTHRRCFVVEWDPPGHALPSGAVVRVLLNIDAAAGVLALGRSAIGEDPSGA